MQLEMEQKLAKEGQQSPEKEKSELESIKWDSTNLRDEKNTSDIIQRVLSDKSSEISSIFRDLTRKMYEKGIYDDKSKQVCLFYLKKTNSIARPYLDKERFDRETTDNIKFQLSSLDTQYEASMNQGKTIDRQSQPMITTSIFS
jgi:hypothetical protein